MPVQVSYPGVYIQEVSSGSRTITGVSTSIALFIGMAERGPMDVPVRILSLAEFERVFGSSNSLGELHDQVTQFYLNGGSTAWIIRIAEGATAAAVTLNNQDGGDALTLSARSPGLVGENLRALVDYNTPTPEMTFNLTIQLWGVDSGGAPMVAVSETFKNVSMDPTHGKYVVNVLAQSSDLVTADDPAAVSAIDGYTLWGQLEASSAHAKLLAAIQATPGEVGRFRVSVDDGPYALVSLAAETSGAIQAAINMALASQGKSVVVSGLDVDGGAAVYAHKIAVNGGRRIRFAQVNGDDDIAEAMMMTSARGALEIDGYAIRRPAPNGYFSRLRFDSDANMQTSFGAFLRANLANLNPLSFTDGIGSPIEPSPTWTAATGSIAAPGAADPTLQAAQQNLDALVAALNADSTISGRWTAARHGHRLVMAAKFNGDHGNAGSTSLSAADSGAFDGYFSYDSNVTRYQLGGTGLPGYQVDAGAGVDGVFPGLGNYKAAFELAERQINLFNILVLPKAEGQSDGLRADLWGPASVFAQGRRAIVLVDPPATWTDRDDVDNEIADLRIGVATDHAAIYWPRIKVSAGAGTKAIDPSGAIAGVMARTDAARGVWKAPAGLEAALLGVRGVEHPMSDGDNGVINPLAVNAIRAFPNGVVSWGARTMVGFDNSGNDDYKYLPVRRLALYIEESLYRGLQWAVFEPNDEPLWRQLRQTAGAFMNNLFRLGAFAGAKSTDAYFVKADRETTTQNDINLGIVNVMIGFAPLKPAEFVVITLQQKAGEVQT
jgi:uncharacterized protein